MFASVGQRANGMAETQCSPGIVARSHVGSHLGDFAHAMWPNFALVAPQVIGLFAHFSGRGAGAVGLPTWTVVYLVVAALAATMLWTRARFVRAQPPAAASSSNRPDTPGIRRIVYLGCQVVFAALVIVLSVVAFAGGETLGTNIAPIAIVGVWWTLGGWVSLVVGSFWVPTDPVLLVRRRQPIHATHWEAVARWIALVLFGVFVVVWVIWPQGDEPRQLGSWLVLSVVGLTALAATRGAVVLRIASPLPRLLDMAAWIVPTNGRFRAAASDRELPLTYVLSVALFGATATDRLQFAGWYQKAFGDGSTWSIVAVNSWLMVCCTAIFAGVWWLVGVPLRRGSTTASPRDATADRHMPEPLPRVGFNAPPGIIAFGAVVASVLLASGLMTGLIQAQNFAVLASDPFSRGWNLFGTIYWQVTQDPISARTAGLIQVAVLTAGHAAALTHLARECVTPHHTVKRRHRMWRAGLPASAAIVASCIVWTLLLLGG